jgi:hypothetical protein
MTGKTLFERMSEIASSRREPGDNVKAVQRLATFKPGQSNRIPTADITVPKVKAK